MSGSEDYDEKPGPKAAGFKFAEGQRLLCFHGPVMYEAKCIKAETRDNRPHYLIHYHGWNKNWDEWVAEDRVRDYNAENKKEADRLKEIQKRASKDSKGTKRKSFGSNSSMSPSPNVDREGETFVKQTGGKESTTSKLTHTTSVLPSTSGKIKEEPRESQPSSTATPLAVPIVKERKKRRTKHEMEQARLEADAARREAKIQDENLQNDVKIDIPLNLKMLLVDDYTNVQAKNLIVNLATVKPIHQVLRDYMKEKQQKLEASNNSNSNKETNAAAAEGKPCNVEDGVIFRKAIVLEVVNGLKLYFNEVIGTQLLYRSERSQYSDVLDKWTRDRRAAGVSEAEIEEQKGKKVGGNGGASGGHHGETMPLQEKSFRTRKNSNAATTLMMKAVANLEPDANSKDSSTIDSVSDRVAQPPRPDLTPYYSAIHLLRMLTKIGRFMSATPDEKAIKLMVNQIGDLLAYFDRHREQLFPASMYTEPGTAVKLITDTSKSKSLAV